MAARTEGVIAKMKREERNEGIIEGRNEGKKDIIKELLKNNTLEEVSQMINTEVNDIKKIIKID